MADGAHIVWIPLHHLVAIDRAIAAAVGQPPRSGVPRVYLKTGSRSGRICPRECQEFSPVFCLSGLGYYEAALDLMRVPGPVRVVESACQCAGDPACVYDLSW